MSISVITVCFNAAATIERTIRSLIQQTWLHVQYVVIDGGSTDGTQDIVGRHSGSVARFISEPDRGIYDAMNKGVALATGDIVFFLNADDAFHDPGVLSDVARAFGAAPDTDLLYGNVVYQSANGSNRQRSFHWVTRRNLVFGDLCHQATFVRRELFDRLGGFNLGYPINADYDFLLRVFSSGARTRYLDRNIALFATGGFHSRDPARHQRERLAVKHKYSSPTVQFLGYWALRAELKLRKLVGQNV